MTELRRMPRLSDHNLGEAQHTVSKLTQERTQNYIRSLRTFLVVDPFTVFIEHCIPRLSLSPKSSFCVSRMEDFGSKKRRMLQPAGALAKKRKKQKRLMAGNAPVECPRQCSVEGKDDPNGQNRHCFDGSEKVMKARTAQLAMIYDNVGYPDVERMLCTEKSKQRFAGVILKAKLLIHGEAEVQEKLASTPLIICGILQQRSSVEKLASTPLIICGILQQRSSVEKLASRPAIGSGILASRPVIRCGILQQRSSMKTELKRELKQKREAAQTKVGSMKRTADLAENLDALKELKRVFRRSPWVMGVFHGARRENQLEKLGLFLKDASVHEDIEADLLDREEGEIY